MNPTQKTAKPAARQRHVDEEAAGQRLDNFLLGELKGVPRSHVYRLIRSGQVRVNSGRVNPKHRLKAGDRVRVPPVATRAPAPVPASGGSLDWLAQRIVYEDARLLVLDKPAGLPIHPTARYHHGTLVGLLRRRHGPGFHAHPAHRLDRETSGLLVCGQIGRAHV